MHFFEDCVIVIVTAQHTLDLRGKISFWIMYLEDCFSDNGPGRDELGREGDFIFRYTCHILFPISM